MDMKEFKFPDETLKNVDTSETVELELENESGELITGTEPEDKVEVEIVDDTPEKDKGRKPLGHTVEEPTDDELNEYSSKVQKRMKELTHARHDERRKAEALAREKLEIERAAQIMAAENKRLREYVSVGQNAYIDKSKSLAEININTAKSRLKEALDAGDTSAAVAAQEELFKAQMQAQEVASFRPMNVEESAPPAQTKTPPAQAQTKPLDDRLVDWAEKNTWFEQPGKEDMTGYAYGLHNKLVRQYGEQYTSTDEYYAKIDKSMRQAFPDEFDDIEPEQEAPPKPAKPRTVVASAQRTTGPKKIRLTAIQQNAAKRFNIPLELYAKEVAKLEASQND